MIRLCFLFSVLIGFDLPALSQSKSQLLIVGGGASGVMAGIQASRMGISVTLVEESVWLGGMLTSAGVSAIDGNHNLPSGLWAEFRQKLYDHYGGPKALETGWVSNTLFEPSVGNNILLQMATRDNLSILFNTKFQSAQRNGEGWDVTLLMGKNKIILECTLIIDATELGDVAAYLKVPYHIGMDAAKETGEPFAPAESNDIIQDLTYVLILRDFGPNADKTIKKPEGYRKEEFECACVQDSSSSKPSKNCIQMMQYGRLPNDKYMINWPKCGNDYYLNLIEKSPAERAKALQEAKLHSLRFLYYLQHELGFKNFGIAEDEFPTKDDFPIIPYHRESRRIIGLARLTAMHMAQPFDQKEAYYRTGIAVGDYPIDHHHDKNPEAPEIDFLNIKVPAYNVPIGSLIPQSVDGLIVAEKSISVSNIANGATRLQPVVMGLGQAAGALAAVSIKRGVQPREVNIREVQQALINDKAYLMPYRDVKPDHRFFSAIQKTGATGILKGTGVPYKWANQTWFYPEDEINQADLVKGLATYFPVVENIAASGEKVNADFLKEVIEKIDSSLLSQKWNQSFEQLNKEDTKENLTRGEISFLIDQLLKPFELRINFAGHLISNNKN